MADSSPSAHAKQRQGFLSGLLGKGKSFWVIAAGAALVAIFAFLQIMGKFTATTTVYVLKQNVAARTHVTTDMLTPMTTLQGGQPRNALDIQDVASHAYYTKIALKAGDVLSPSTVGPLERITAGLPANFVAASFQVSAENAVAGKVTKGDFIDLIAKEDANGAAGGAKVVLHHVLVLDVTVAPSSIAAAANGGPVGGPESNVMRSGIPSLYTVGLSPQDATTLALVRDKSLFVVLSANNAAGGSLSAESTADQVFGSSAAADSSAGIPDPAASQASTPDAQKSSAPTPNASASSKSGN